MRRKFDGGDGVKSCDEQTGTAEEYSIFMCVRVFANRRENKKKKEKKE